MNNLPQDPRDASRALAESARTGPTVLNFPNLNTPHEPPAAANAALSMPEILRILKRRWPILAATSLLFVALGAIVSVLTPKTYESTASVLLESPGNASLSVGGNAAALAALMGGVQSNDTATQIELMTGDANLREVARRLHLTLAPKDLRGAVTVEPDKSATEVVQVTAHSGTALGAARLAHEVIQVYQDSLGHEDATTVGRTSAVMRAQLLASQKALDRAEDRYAAYSQSIGSIAPDVENGQVVGQLFALQTQYLQTQRDIKTASALAGYYRGQVAKLPATQVPSVSFGLNPRIEDDKGKLAALEQQRATLAAQYTPKDDAMVANQSQIDAVKADMIAEREQQAGVHPNDLGSVAINASDASSGNYVVNGGQKALNPNREDAATKLIEQQASLEASQAQSDALRANLADVKNTVLETPSKHRRLTDLQDDVALSRSIYDDLRSEYSQLQARRGAESVYAKVLQDPTVPLHQISPRPLLYSGLALMLGLMIGSIGMLWMDNLEVRFRDENDARRNLGLPVLGTIPDMGRLRNSGSLFEDQVSPAFRRLATTLAYKGVGSRVRSLLITSAVTGEGVTFVASQLALALAKEGKRVILVDANVRNPTIHRLFGTENNEGWAGLMRNGANPDNALVSVVNAHPLRLIPGGSVVDHATTLELIQPDKVQMLLQDLQKSADIVIVDAPAVFNGIDTATLADNVQGIVFVAGVEYTTRDISSQALELLRNCRAPVIGVVVNSPHE